MTATRRMTLKYDVSEADIVKLRKFASITGQRSIRDFLSFAITEYTALLQETLDRVQRESTAAEASAPVDAGSPAGPDGALPAPAQGDEGGVVPATVGQTQDVHGST